MNNWICQRCSRTNVGKFCQICGAQAADSQTPPFQMANQAQFPPQQSAPPFQPQSYQPPTPQKLDGKQNLLLVGAVVAIFVVAISFIVWIGVFGAPGLKKVLPILLLLTGSLMTVGNAALSVRKILKLKRSTKTMGVVMNVEVKQGMQQMDYTSARNSLFKPTVRFQTADGRTIDYTPDISSSASNYRVGENVPVYYDSQQPERAIVGRFYNLWFQHFVFGAVGGLLLLVGTLFLLVADKFPSAR